MIHTGGPQWVAEAFHGAFAVPGRLMGVLRPVVEVSGLPVLDSTAAPPDAPPDSFGACRLRGTPGVPDGIARSFNM